MELLPIRAHLDQNGEFANHPDCQEGLYLSIDVYKKVGFEIPWIGYYVKVDDQIVGSCAFKGKPVHGKVEIAYGTIPKFQRQGIGTEICRQLVQLAQKTDPSIRILARTFLQENYSTRILRKNGFELLGTVMDDDGEVWEWEYRHAVLNS